MRPDISNPAYCGFYLNQKINTMKAPLILTFAICTFFAGLIAGDAEKNRIGETTDPGTKYRVVMKCTDGRIVQISHWHSRNEFYPWEKLVKRYREEGRDWFIQKREINIGDPAETL